MSEVHASEAEGEREQPPGWMRVVVPLMPAGLTFGPLLMVIPSGSLIAYSGALLLGVSLAGLFIVVGTRLLPKA